jgi:hypothetical protein
LGLAVNNDIFRLELLVQCIYVIRFETYMRRANIAGLVTDQRLSRGSIFNQLQEARSDAEIDKVLFGSRTAGFDRCRCRKNGLWGGREMRSDDIDLLLKVKGLESRLINTIYKTGDDDQLVYSTSCNSAEDKLADLEKR